MDMGVVNAQAIALQLWMSELIVQTISILSLLILVFVTVDQSASAGPVIADHKAGRTRKEKYQNRLVCMVQLLTDNVPAQD